MDGVEILIFILSILVVIFHIISVTLLLKTKVSNLNDSQKYLLISLCMTELLLGFCSAIVQIIRLLDIKNAIPFPIYNFQMTTLYFLYCSVMILITIERFLEFYLNIKYRIYWSPKKTLAAITLVATSSVSVFLCTVLVKNYNQLDFIKVYLMYVYPAMEFMFMVAATATYFMIYNKILEIKRQKKRLEKQIERNSSIPSIVHHKKKRIFGIYLPSLIIITFIFFNIIPNLTINIVFYVRREYRFHKIMIILYHLGWLSDPMIYIFTLKAVRKTMKRFIHYTN